MLSAEVVCCQKLLNITDELSIEALAWTQNKLLV